MGLPGVKKNLLKGVVITPCITRKNPPFVGDENVPTHSFQ